MVKSDGSGLFTMRMTAQDKADLAYVMKARNARSAAQLFRLLLVEEIGDIKRRRALTRERLDQ